MPPFIIEADALSKLMNSEEVLLIDLSNPDTYQQTHLEGAIHVSPSELISGKQPAVGKLPELSRLNALFSRIGYSPEQHIVAYDDEGGGWAGRFLWTLDVIGHQNMSYLNGGIHAWTAMGLATTREIAQVQASKPSLSLNRHYRATKEDILTRLKDPDTLIWDARSAEEYQGSKVFAARGGHIPGAINLEWLALMDPQRQLRIRSDIASLLDNLGLSKDKKIITHCQTHHRSGLSYIVAKSLGYRVQAYDGSWSEWGNDSETPIEIG